MSPVSTYSKYSTVQFCRYLCTVRTMPSWKPVCMSEAGFELGILAPTTLLDDRLLVHTLCCCSRKHHLADLSLPSQRRVLTLRPQSVHPPSQHCIHSRRGLSTLPCEWIFQLSPELWSCLDNLSESGASTLALQADQLPPRYSSILQISCTVANLPLHCPASKTTAREESFGDSDR